MASQKYVKELLLQKAPKSSCRYKIAAIGLDRLGNVVGCVTNEKRFNHYGGGLHAEMRLIKRYGKRVKSIFICRVNRQGDLMHIDPCERCQKVLDKLEIKVYSIGREE